jgi:hypothetical protein
MRSRRASVSHGMVTRRHTLGQTGDEVTVARDHHERAALSVAE